MPWDDDSKHDQDPLFRWARSDDRQCRGKPLLNTQACSQTPFRGMLCAPLAIGALSRLQESNGLPLVGYEEGPSGVKMSVPKEDVGTSAGTVSLTDVSLLRH